MKEEKKKKKKSLFFATGVKWTDDPEDVALILLVTKFISSLLSTMENI